MERYISVHSQSTRDFSSFLELTVKLDESSVVRLESHSPAFFRVWAYTPFKTFATRLIRGHIKPEFLVCAADHLLEQMDKQKNEVIDPGNSFDSLWKQKSPETAHFTYLEDISAQTVLDLAEKGMTVAQENKGPLGFPPSLLNQPVITVRHKLTSTMDNGNVFSTAKIPMRAVLTLATFSFIPSSPAENEPIRVRKQGSRIRLDARYGSVYSEYIDNLLR